MKFHVAAKTRKKRDETTGYKGKVREKNPENQNLHSEGHLLSASLRF